MRSWAAIMSAVLCIGQLAPFPSYADAPKLPVFPPLQFKPPKPERWQMPNGLTVFFLEDHELPLVRMQMLIHTGTQYERASEVGLGSIFGEAMSLGGSTTYPPEALQKVLDKTAASIGFGMELEQGVGDVSCRTADLDTIFPIFVDILRHPLFRKDILETARTKALEGLRRLNDDAAEVGRREFRRAIYGPQHPYARTPSPDTFKGIKAADLLQWHAHYFHPNNAFLAISGDFNTEKMKSQLAQALGDWPKTKVVFPEVPMPRAPEAGVFYIQRSLNQTQIRIGHLGLARLDPDSYAWIVFNELWGGSSTSELFKTIRTQKGLAYSVNSSYWQPQLPGLIVAICQTRGAQTIEAIQGILEINKKSVDAPFSSAEIANAKDFIRNRFVANFTSSAQIARQFMELEYYGYPKDYLDTYTDRIGAITAEDLKRVARAHLKPSQSTLLVVGDLSTFDKPLSIFGKPVRLELLDYTGDEEKQPGANQ